MHQKTRLMRMMEIKNLCTQLNEMGVDERFDGYTEFWNSTQTYVKHGTESTGAIPIQGTNRVLIYTLSNDKSRACTVVLRARD